MDRQHDVIATIGTQGQRPAELGVAQIGDELRQADKVGDRLAAIGFHDQAQLPLGRGVAEPDVVLKIEHHDAVGQRLQGGDDALQIVFLARDPGPQVLFVAIEAAENVIPGTFAFQRVVDDRRP